MKSSKDLIAKIRNQRIFHEKSATTTTTVHDSVDKSATSFSDNRETMIIDLRDYLFGCGGRATTQSIVDNFKLKISEDDVPLFRNMLKKIADFEKSIKTWRLKKEFS